MTKNGDIEQIYRRTAGLVAEFEHTRDPESSEIGRQFERLQRTMIENRDVLSCHEGAKPVNRLKNRYKDVLPYDKCRVILKSENGSDYINASFIEDLYGRRRYIAAQGPIEESTEDFCRMICDFQITSIVCTANDVEAGRFKFRRYWPDDDEDSIQFGNYRVTKDRTSDKAYSCNDYEIRPLTIACDGTQQRVLLYHFLHWADHDIPNEEASIFDLLVRLYQNREPSTDSPILVHCSAGCGRTGSVIAIDLCRLFLDDEHLLSNEDYHPYPVFKIATYIRQYRIALIQTLKQYFFVHKAFLFLMKTHGNISVHSADHNDENQTFSSLTIKPCPPRRPSGPLQITLRNPPIGRRLLNGSNTSNTPSPTISPSEFFPPSSKSSSMNDTPPTPDAPPIPPRCSLVHTTSTQHENQFNHADTRSARIARQTDRSRHVGRSKPTNTRSDSADVHSVLAARYHQLQVSHDQEPNSD